MKIDIQYVQMPTSESMNAFITKKLNKLASKYDWVIRAQVHFKLENDPTKKGKICEIELSAPGPRIFAKSNEEHFEKAAISSIQDLEKQLKKRKEVFLNH
ncbi:ribosome hibernation-promoting factor, HPF/YfiA family [Maribacter sp. 2308TA10-17]|uniref:ribosome hibernation-promoting factor, HPF/YfiA family n=1 Tax=Maribacter sp. 2308TA10-17 TaxID=3386276 RepID=UPI0039BC9586